MKWCHVAWMDPSTSFFATTEPIFHAQCAVRHYMLQVNVISIYIIVKAYVDPC